MHMTDNGYNEIRGGRDAGGDEKQLIKFAWPNLSAIRCNDLPIAIVQIPVDLSICADCVVAGF